MKLTTNNVNYTATVVRLSTFVDLKGCDNVKGALIFHNQVILSKTHQEGELGIYFPVECALSPEFLKRNNLYREASLNADPTKKGFFELNGRVRAVKFRGHKSEGF